MFASNNQLINEIIESGIMTQSELSKELGVTEACVSQWKNGKTKVPGVAVKYLNLIIGNLQNKLYSRSLDLLRISMKKLAKESPTAQNDILDIVNDVFNK